VKNGFIFSEQKPGNTYIIVQLTQIFTWTSKLNFIQYHFIATTRTSTHASMCTGTDTCTRTQLCEIWDCLRGGIESSRTVIVVTAPVKEDESGGQGHASKILLHQYATRHCAVNIYCLSVGAFSTLCFVLCVMNGKIEQRDCIRFCV
jgi:hypothetical protein